MKFKKVCFVCGSKGDVLYDGKCLKCFKEETPPVKEIKPVNLKICNSCSKIHYNNQLLTKDEIEKLLPQIMKSRIEMNGGYKLKDVVVENVEFVGNKVVFDLMIDSELAK